MIARLLGDEEGVCAFIEPGNRYGRIQVVLQCFKERAKALDH